MSIFIVEKVLGEPKGWTSGQGSEMLTYQLWGSIDGQPAEMAQINTIKSKPKVPVEGEKIECTYESTNHGLKLKRVAPTPQGQNQPQTTPVSVGYQRNPEDQLMIMRQHAVTDAISFFAMQGATVAKSISDTTVILQAERFLSYYKNGTKQFTESNQTEEEPLPNYEEGEEELEVFN